MTCTIKSYGYPWYWSPWSRQAVQTSPCRIPCPCQKAGLKRQITKVGFVFANAAYLVTQNDNLIIKTSEDGVTPSDCGKK